MQSPQWYYNRLKSMSLSEIIWRVKQLTNSYIEQLRIISGAVPEYKDAFSSDAKSISFGFTLPPNNTDDLFSEGGALFNSGVSTITKADSILEHKFSYFNHTDKFLGEPINWHFDYNISKQSPRGLSAYIDYRDIRTSGDCKEVWEPNRHHQLPVLARAYQLTNNEKYLEEIVRQIESWIRDNPYGTGMNWRSPLELGIRVINWVYTLELVRKTGHVPNAVYKDILQSIYLHCWDISRKFSKGSSANNHLVGEAAGVFVATSWLPDMKNATLWNEESKKILCQEIHRQTYSDGCTKEQAIGYEFFVLQFYIVCGLVGQWSGNAFPDDYWKKISTMFEFLADLAQGGKQFPMFGDRDDGYVLDLGDRPEDIDALMNVGAILFKKERYGMQSNRITETAYWLFGSEGVKTLISLSGGSNSNALISKSYPDSGYYLLQHGYTDDDSISILFDCAELGYGNIAAHGHADALSIMLRVGGNDVLVDPGTYDYFTYPEWRKYFRSTAAHNTLEIDGENQSELLGPFLWGKRANAKCITWQPEESGGHVYAEHDGYKRLGDPVIHRRKIILEGDKKTITIKDEVLCKGEHKAKLYFHLGEDCAIDEMKGNHVTMQVDGKIVTMSYDSQCRIKKYFGEEKPIIGWLSRNYHKKEAINTLVACFDIQGDTSVVTKIKIY